MLRISGQIDSRGLWRGNFNAPGEVLNARTGTSLMFFRAMNLIRTLPQRIGLRFFCAKI
jgi:hypothetical protein